MFKGNTVTQLTGITGIEKPTLGNKIKEHLSVLNDFLVDS